MSTLVVETLIDSLTQDLEFKLNERVHIGSFIPYLYVHGYSSAVFNFTLSGSSGTVFSKNFTIQDIKDSLVTTDNYIIDLYPIIPTNPVQISKGAYSLTLSAISGYASGATFIGWVKQHENIQNTMDYLPLSDDQNSFTLRYKIYKEGIL